MLLAIFSECYRILCAILSPCQQFAMILTIVFFLVVLSCTVFFRQSLRKQTRYPLPPGPKKLPIVGNLFNMPRSGVAWLEYTALSRQYKSDIIHLSVLDNSIVVVNSAKIASDLLDKRSLIYSSRRSTIMLGKLVGWETVLPFRSNDSSWKQQRKIMSQAFPTDSTRFYPMLMRATRSLLKALPCTDDIFDPLHVWAAVTIMDVTYGMNAEEAKAHLPIAEGAIEAIIVAGIPGAFFVDHIPILRYIPEWFPGAGFKIKAKIWAELRERMTNLPFGLTKERVAMGVAKPSLTSVALEQIDDQQDVGEQEALIKTAAVAAYAGGSDTTVTALHSFIWAMLQYPEVQIQAHHELDRVVGPGNLPSFAHKASLPYIAAIVQETMRYYPVAPVVPHRLIVDDIYNGYLLPRGSAIVSNIGSMLYNEEVYPQPNIFNPARFLNNKGNLNPNVKDPADYAFGFGRRVCPGKSFASASLWLAIASILSCYSIEPKLDEHGEPIKPQLQERTQSGLTLLNKIPPFKCRFVPRSGDLPRMLDSNGED
ncbi:cytochrome P450 [Lentinula raphanica]|nr:cytochrome P450 [Lentinula raphanica]